VTASQAYPGDHPKIFVAGVQVELVVEVEAEPVAEVEAVVEVEAEPVPFPLGSLPPPTGCQGTMTLDRQPGSLPHFPD